MFLTKVNFTDTNLIKNINFAGVYGFNNPAIDSFFKCDDEFVPSETANALKKAEELKQNDKEKHQKYLAFTVAISDDDKPFFNMMRSDIQPLYRTLTPDEAIDIVMADEDHAVADENLPVFLKLKDEGGLDNISAMKFAHSNKKVKRLLELTTADEYGHSVITSNNGKQVVLSRPLTIKEAIPAVKMKTNQTKLYQAILDRELDIKKAVSLVRYPGDAYRFLMLTTENENGGVGIVDNAEIALSRALTANEAFRAVKYDMSFGEIKRQLDNFGTVYGRHKDKNPLKYDA